jgi:uncharacterized RDD family membrane protein YckC
MTTDQQAALGDGVVVEAAAARGACTDVSPHPWRRFGARLLDIQVMGTFMTFLAGVGLYAVSPGLFAGVFGRSNQLLDRLLMAWILTVLVIPANALTIGLAGSSIGKWLFGIRVVRKDGRRLGVLRAFMRELRVLFMGLGFNLPLISLVTMGMSYGKLEDRRATSWDLAQRNLVLHRPRGIWQTLLGGIGVIIVVGIAGYGWWLRLLAAASAH